MVTTPITPGAAKFLLGQLVVTDNAQANISRSNVTEALRRHASGDWGEICREDAGSNDQALRHGGRLMSAYTREKIRFWVITEADRRITTVLLPQDY